VLEVFTETDASAALIASMVHYQRYTVQHIKDYLAERGVPVRRCIS
jgi:cyclase